MMEESLNDELNFDELVEGSESPQEEGSGQEKEGDGIVEQREEDNVDETEH